MSDQEHDLERAEFARHDEDLAELIARAQDAAAARGKAWGPEDAAHFARANRSLVRAWMRLMNAR